MEEGETRKFEIDKNNKPKCQYPEKEITIGKKSHSVKNNNKWIYGVVELDYQAYINCFPGEVDFLFTAGIAQNCGVGKILMKLCLNEEKIHNVENNEENDAMSDLKLSADLSKNDVFKKFVKNIETDCSKLIYLMMTADVPSKGHIYFKSAEESGYSQMFIETQAPGKETHPKSGTCSVSELAKLYNDDGYIIDGDDKVYVRGKAWFFCLPKKPEIPKGCMHWYIIH